MIRSTVAAPSVEFSESINMTRLARRAGGGLAPAFSDASPGQAGEYLPAVDLLYTFVYIYIR